MCTSSTRPSAPYEGQMIYETDTNRVLIWDNAAWVMIADTDTPPGLQFITSMSVTAQSELVIDNCYSSAFTNYLLMVRLQTTVSDSFYQNRVGGSNAQTNYNRQLLEAQSTAVTTSTNNTQTSFVFTSNSNGAFWQTAEVNVFSPAVAEPTGIQVNHCRTNGGYTVPSAFLIYGNHSTATAYDGFRVFVPSGTLTGTIRVYGYRD